MRANSGSGKSNNNLHDPTLKEHERERGHSGQAPIIGRDELGTERKGTTGSSTSGH